MRIKKYIAVALAAYLAAGVIFALSAWVQPLKAFTCVAPDEPHGTIGVGSMWANPDPSRCTRDGLAMRHIAPLPYLAIAWPLAIGAKTYFNWQENEMRKAAALESRIAEIQAAHEPGEREALSDGESVWAGVYHASPIENNLKSFSDEELAVSLRYPADFLLFKSAASEDDARELPLYEGYYGILIAPEEPMLRSIARLRAGAGGGGAPPAISMSFFRNTGSLSLEEWLRTHEGQSNFHHDVPYDPSLNATLTHTTVDGVPAVRYRSILGMYDMDHVAFLHGGRVVILSSPVALADDFRLVVSSLRLTSD